jgi:hypothetical protein
MHALVRHYVAMRGLFSPSHAPPCRTIASLNEMTHFIVDYLDMYYMDVLPREVWPMLDRDWAWISRQYASMSDKEKEASATSVRTDKPKRKKRKRTSYVAMMAETMDRNTSETKFSLPPAVVPEKVKTI